MDPIILDITTQKNLLAFSAGIDSTALFFLMLEQDIPFDIAIVNYHQRIESTDEVIYATQLAHKYKKKCFVSSFPQDQKFSEKSARDYRYNFFEAIIEENNYEALLTAHQLNDTLEWFLMQLTKGAGLPELLGIQAIRKKKTYLLLKPLLQVSKNTLQGYLDRHKHRYFIDSSNYDEKYTRNYFRHTYSDSLIEKYEKGITQSFSYLNQDNQSLLNTTSLLKNRYLHRYTFNGDINIAIRIIDKDLKERGVLISQQTRQEIQTKKVCVVAHKYAIAIEDTTIFIAPYITNLAKKMDKKFKEKCRITKIPKNIRAYIFQLYEENLFTF